MVIYLVMSVCQRAIGNAYNRYFEDGIPPSPLLELRFAIPQITARTDGINEDTTRSNAARAVQSIPAYVEACDLLLEGRGGGVP